MHWTIADAPNAPDGVGSQSMRVAHVVGGLGIIGFGFALHSFVTYWTSTDERLRRIAESRWRIARYSDRPARHGEIGKTEWVEKRLPGLRREQRAWQRPMLIFCIAFGVFVISQGFVN